MEEYTRYGEIGAKKIREILLDYKKENALTNQQMSARCDISSSEYDKLMNFKRHGKHGPSYDTLYKIHKNLKIDANLFFDI